MYQNTNILTYDNTFGTHHITFTGVAEEIFRHDTGNSMRGRISLSTSWEQITWMEPNQYLLTHGAEKGH